MRRRTPPGEILDAEFLGPLGLTAAHVSERTGVDVAGIVAGRVRVNEDVAWVLGSEFRTTAEFWMNVQRAVDFPGHPTPRRR